MHTVFKEILDFFSSIGTSLFNVHTVHTLIEINIQIRKLTLLFITWLNTFTQMSFPLSFTPFTQKVLASKAKAKCSDLSNKPNPSDIIH